MSSQQISVLLLDLAMMFVGCSLLGALATRIGQPVVIGELLGGILLGPTVLGSWSHIVVPAAIRPALVGLGNIGVALFMFGLGLEFHRSVLRDSGRKAVGIAAGAMVLPFILGSLLGMLLLATHYEQNVHPIGFPLFLGIAMSITAFPVLSRILTDRRLSGTELGMLAMAVAALCDILAWSGLAAVIALVNGAVTALWRVALVVPFAIILLSVVRPVLRRLSAPISGNSVVACLFAGALGCGAVTELLGIHFIFGAFLFGLIAPRTPALEGLAGKAFDVSRFFLPVYFAVAGLQVDLHLTFSTLGLLALIVLVAVVGKVTGTYGAARLCKLSHTLSVLLATLMNTRGLTELIVLTAGLDLKIIDQKLYSVMVVMALLTTAATGPLLTLYGRKLGTTNPITDFGIDHVPAQR